MFLHMKPADFGVIFFALLYFGCLCLRDDLFWECDAFVSFSDLLYK